MLSDWNDSDKGASHGDYFGGDGPADYNGGIKFLIQSFRQESSVVSLCHNNTGILYLVPLSVLLWHDEWLPCIVRISYIQIPDTITHNFLVRWRELLPVLQQTGF